MHHLVRRLLGSAAIVAAAGAGSALMVSSANATIVDFEDWEAQTSARDVAFLWPNGDELDARAEGYIDDYHFLTPTGSPDLQVMYITITDGAIAPISVTAILRNP